MKEIFIKENYSTVLEGLRKRVADLEQKTEIFKRAKKEGRAITLEEARTIDSSLDDSALTNNEVSLVLQAKINSTKEKDSTSTYEPIVLSPAETLEFISYLKQKSELSPNEQYDIILSSGEPAGHCTPIQIGMLNGKPQLIALDATLDQGNFYAISEIRKVLEVPQDAFQLTVLDTQKDPYSCSIFSAQDLRSIYKLNKEEKFVAHHSRFLKNSQSQRRLDKYKETEFYLEDQIISGKGDKAKTLDSYLRDFSISVEVVEGGVKTTKVKNYSILLKKEKYLKKAIKLLEQIPEDMDRTQALLEILNQRRGGEVLNIEFRLDKVLEFKKTLSPEQLEKITYYNYDSEENETLSNLQQIDLALNHGVDVKILARARLAFSGKFSDSTYQYILTAKDQDHKNELAKKLIKIRYDEPLIALIKYGIEAKGDSPLRSMSETLATSTLSAMEDVYSQALGNNQDKQEAVHQFYQEISKIKEAIDVELIKDEFIQKYKNQSDILVKEDNILEHSVSDIRDKNSNLDIILPKISIKEISNSEVNNDVTLIPTLEKLKTKIRKITSRMF